VMPSRPGPPPGRGRRNTTNRPARRRRTFSPSAADAPLAERPPPPCSATKSHLRRSRRAFGKPNPPRGPGDTRLLPVVGRSQTPAPLAPPPVDHLAPLPRRHPLPEPVRSLAPRTVRLVGSFHGITSHHRPGSQTDPRRRHHREPGHNQTRPRSVKTSIRLRRSPRDGTHPVRRSR